MAFLWQGESLQPRREKTAPFGRASRCCDALLMRFDDDCRSHAPCVAAIRLG